MKKLLFVISQFYKGGAETSLLSLLKYIDKSKYEVDLIVMDQRPAKNAVSLIEQLPKEIHVLDAWREEQRLSLADRVRAKLLLTETDRSTEPVSALLYVRKRYYDWAFHVGEWWPPKFVAENVHAKNRCAWIHTDISKAKNFDAEGFFYHDAAFAYYLFVSRNSMESSLEKYPFIRSKARTVYNISDVSQIREAAEAAIEESCFQQNLPVVLTLANVRKEKGHQRALEAMGLLKAKGLDFLWVNVGSTTETERCQNLLSYADELGLRDRFLLLGPRNNPYPYLRRADIVAVLSDYESWSMVITEAKILGKPILATRTSGALEQIEDGTNGLLTDFDKADIADKLERLLVSKELRETFSNNLRGFDNTEDILQTFDALTEEDPVAHAEKELLYIIDDINYMGGAHIATKLQIKALLKKNISITVFSSSIPTTRIRNELLGVRFLSFRDFPEDQLFHRRLLDCLLDPRISQEEKSRKKEWTRLSKRKLNTDLYEEQVLPHIKNLFSGYKTICVMSEGSGFRKYVAEASADWKVQWIHTDYCRWRVHSSWTRNITENDLEIYSKFNKIVLLTEEIERSFLALYPQLQGKTAVNANLMPVDTIIEKAALQPKKNRPFFVTVGRFSAEKAYDRLFRLLCRLSREGYQYHWTIIGGGEQYEDITRLFSDSEIKNNVTFTGALQNPYPLMKEADVFALFSTYEGLPTTIFESLILGVPVIATDVGGISTQLIDGTTGWLVENDEEKIYQKLKYLLDCPNVIRAAKENLKDYRYDNKKILSTAEEILCPETVLKKRRSC